jgi:hypothetical protein
MTGHDGTPGKGLSTCPGCGLTAPERPGAAPEERSVSAACWAMYGQVLARSYTDPRYRVVHQMVVDAYTAQHAGGTSRRRVQEVALCLMTLCRVIENGVDPAQGPALHKRMVAHRPDFTWLEPPREQAPMTVADILTAHDAEVYCQRVREWGHQVWQVWASHHATIRAWNADALTLR